MDSSTPSTSTPSPPSPLSLFNVRSRVTVKLRFSNYQQWKTQFLPFLRSQNLLGFIDGSVKAPPVTIQDEIGAEQSNPKYLNWLQADQLIVSWINATLAEESLCHVVGLDTAQDAWKKLEDVHTLQHMDRESQSMQQYAGHTIVGREKGKTTMMKNKETDKASWKDSIRKKLNSLDEIYRQTPPPTIVRVPSRIRRLDDAAYEPQIVSIGPYHRGNEKLQAMEKHKWQYLHDFLSRKSGVRLDDFLDDLQTKEKIARNCYSEDVSLSSTEFVEMMVLDGCFVVEFFLKCNGLRLATDSPDPICDTTLVLDTVGYDLLLVENQLPFFVLSHIFDTYGPSNPASPLDELTMEFFRRLSDVVITSSDPVPMGSTHHLLHLVYTNLIPPLPPRLPSQKHNSLLEKVKSLLSSSSHLLPICRLNSYDDIDDPSHASQPRWNIPNVQGLQEAGIKISKAKGENFFVIKFKKGVMEIPYVVIDDFTNTFLRNMIAYEQIHRPNRIYFTTYASLMDDLIKTTKDVEELTYKGIIENALGSHEDVTVLFNQIGKGTIVYYDDHSLKLTAEVNRYCSSKRHMWRAKLVRDYFSNPWAIISLIGALVLLILTFVQSLFSILSYVHPPS